MPRLPTLFQTAWQHLTARQPGYTWQTRAQRSPPVESNTGALSCGLPDAVHDASLTLAKQAPQQTFHSTGAILAAVYSVLLWRRSDLWQQEGAGKQLHCSLSTYHCCTDDDQTSGLCALPQGACSEHAPAQYAAPATTCTGSPHSCICSSWCASLSRSGVFSSSDSTSFACSLALCVAIVAPAQRRPRSAWPCAYPHACARLGLLLCSWATRGPAAPAALCAQAAL